MENEHIPLLKSQWHEQCPADLFPLTWFQYLKSCSYVAGVRVRMDPHSFCDPNQDIAVVSAQIIQAW